MITANYVNSSLTGKTKQRFHNKFIGTTCRRSDSPVNETRQDLCIFTTLISQQNRDIWRNGIEMYFEQQIHLSTQLRKQFAVLTALRSIHCVTASFMQIVRICIVLILRIQSREQVPLDGEIFSPRKDWAHDFRHLASGLLRGLDQLEWKRTPFFKLFNVRTSLFCCFQKRLTLNLQEKANRLKIFIRTNYVPLLSLGDI